MRTASRPFAGLFAALASFAAIASLTASAAFSAPGGTGSDPTEAPRPVVVFAGPAMGTRYSVSVVMRNGDAEATEQVQAAIDREFALVDRAFSRWNPDSELTRFNAQQSTEALAVSAEMVEVALTAERVALLTEGAFDVTVAPLIDAWGFAPNGGRQVAPSPETLTAARAKVGHTLLHADAKRRTLRKARPDVAIDMNGIVAGWVADRIASTIVRLGHGDVLVDAGGEIAARGRRPDGALWRVAVESPTGGRAARSRLVALDQVAVATSGDYRKFWTDDEGRRASHIVDPRSGETVTHGLASATVVHADGAFADAVGTALLVLGPQRAREIALREQWAVSLVERRADGTWAEWSSPPFEALLVR